jgi:hypothetical protein
MDLGAIAFSAFVIMVISLGIGSFCYLILYPYLLSVKSGKELHGGYPFVSNLVQILWLNEYIEEMDESIKQDPEILRVKKVAKFFGWISLTCLILLLLLLIVWAIGES